MSRTVFSALAAIVLAAAILMAAVDASTVRFKSHPHIRCSVCMSIAEKLGNKMNESAKIKTSVLRSHRLEHTKTGPQGAVGRRVDYESSELRAVELLEDICKEVSDSYQLKEDADRIRRFSSNKSLPNPKWYGIKDKEQLDGHPSKLKDTCFEFTDDHDELLTKLIMRERELETIQKKLCVEGIKVCHTKAYYVGLKKEKELREKWEARQEAKRLKREEDEEKARLQREKEAGFDKYQPDGKVKEGESAEADPTATDAEKPVAAEGKTEEQEKKDEM